MKVAHKEDCLPAIVFFLADEPEPEPGQHRRPTGSDSLVAVVTSQLAKSAAQDILLEFKYVRANKLNGYDIGELIQAFGKLAEAGKAALLIGVTDRIAQQLRQRAANMFLIFADRATALAHLGVNAKTA